MTIEDILNNYELGLITRKEAVNQIGNLVIDQYLISSTS